MRLSFPFVFLLASMPGFVQALGLGELDLDSALNEPFEARIELLSATTEELDSLSVLLADQETFQRAGIPRELILAQLRFEVSESETGPDYIRIYSIDPITEPFLNFLLEISWSKGRLFREYTVLIDPPIYATAEKQQKLAQPAAPPALVEGAEEHVVVYEQAFKEHKTGIPTPSVSTVPSARQISYEGGDYGPTVTGDTLWSLAKAMRPDSSVSIQQTMLALLHANPGAFINDNINGLKRGHVLKMPDMTDIQSVTKEEAFAEAKIQNSLWEEARTAIASAVTQRPEGADTALAEEKPEAIGTTAGETPAPAPVEKGEQVAVEPEGKPELRLVPVPGEGEGAMEQGTAESVAGEAGNVALKQELALVNESLEALKMENTELKDKLSETEAIIGDLKRLIVLKEDELATLQQHIASAEAEKVKAAQEAAEKAPPEKATEEVIMKEEGVEEQPVEEIVKEPVVAGGAEAEKEAMVKEEAAEKTEVAKEAEATEDTAPAKKAEITSKEEPPVETAAKEGGGIISTFLPSGFMGVVIDQLKNNMMMVAGGFAVVLLIVFLSSYAMRRRSEVAIEIPASAFPDFEDMAAETVEPSEDITDINQALRDSEAQTILPGDEEETIQPDAAAAKTRIITPGAQAAAPAAAAPAAREEDQMAEFEQKINTFLAYEDFGQAEDFVKKAIAKEPDNLELHTKLLEVYYAAGNKKGYEKAAEVLHDKVGGRGEHWDMALAMWQEISPNRALFQTPVAGEEEAAGPITGGGIVNIAGDAGQAAGGLDFDLEATAEKGEDVLNITAAQEEGADILDVTAAIDIEDEEEVLDVTAAAAQEEAVEQADEGLDISLVESNDILDISSGAGSATPAAADDGSIDFTLDSAGEEEPALDISRESSDNLLDVTFAGVPGGEESGEALDLVTDNAESILDVSHGGDSLLDVTSTTDFKPEGGDDLLDVTSAGGTHLAAKSAKEPAITTSATKAADENVIEFDLGMPAEEPKAGVQEEAGLDFEITPDKESVATDTGDSALTFDIGLDISSQATGEIPRGGLDLELQIDEGQEGKGDSLDMERTMEIPKPKAKLAAVDSSMKILKSEKDSGGALEFEIPEVDMEGTVAMPHLGMDESEAVDEGGDHTVIVPRTSGSGEQSAEDEIATQLDLAKAYVELGDKDNARTILDEIVATGNSEQRQQAQELLGQIS